MKHLLSLILLMLLTITINAQQDTQTGDCTVTARNDFARVRASWNIDADEVARIGATDNARYVARGRNASEGFTWYYIGIGWVRADVVNAVGNCDNLPVVFTEASGTFSSELYPCPADFSGYLPAQLTSGQTSLHVNDHGSAYFVYILPEASASVVGYLPNNTVIDRIGIGPLCHNGAVFWEAESGSLRGFIMESNRNTNQYYLSTTDLTIEPTPTTGEQTNPSTQPIEPVLNTPYKIYEGSPATDLSFSADSRLIAGLTYPAEQAIIWDVTTDTYNVLTWATPIIKAQFGGDANQFLTADDTGHITTWDVSGQTAPQTTLVTLPENAELFTHATFSPEGSRVALNSCTEQIEEQCNRGVIVVADVATGGTVAEINILGRDINLMALSPYGNALAVSDGDDVILWTDVVNAPSGSRTVPTYNIIHATDLTFIPSGTRLLVAGCQETRIQTDEALTCSFSTFGTWTVDENIIETMRGNVFEGTVNGLSVTSDNETFVTSTHTIDSYQLANGTRIRTYHQPDTNYQDVLFSPDGNIIASADGEGKIMLWRR